MWRQVRADQPWRGRLVRVTTWAAVFAVVLVLNRRLVVQPFNVSLVTPAAGVALVWLASASSRAWLVVDSVLLTVVSMAVLAATGGTPAQIGLLVLSPVQPVLALLLMRRWVPLVWGAGGRQTVRSLRDLGMTVLAMVIGVVVYTALRAALAPMLLPAEGLPDLVARLARGISALTTVGLVGLLVAGWLAERTDARLPVIVRPSRWDAAHLVGASTGVAVVFVLGFWLSPHSPTTFVLTLPVLWVSIRFGPVLTSLFALAVGSIGVWLTLEGLGPIATIDSPLRRAGVSEVLVMLLLVLGMVMSLSRQQVLATVSQLEASEQALRTRAAELDLLISELDDGVAIIEEGGTFVHSNHALRLLFTGPDDRDAFDATRMQPAGSYHLYRANGEPLSDDDLPYVRVLNGLEVDEEDLVLRSPSVPGGRVLRVSAQQLPTEPAARRRVLVTVRDVTEENNRQMALATFARTVAHDLNSPLLVVDGWAEAIEDELSTPVPDTAAVRPMVGHIRSGVDQMRTFVADLLAHAVARDQALRCERVSLDELVDDVASARARPGATHAVHVDGPLGDVWADRLMVRQVLDNVIGNAVKYVDPGTDPVVRVSTSTATAGWLRVEVRDNGIGITPEERGRIFETFHRASEGAVYTGTGLGLAICRRIVDRHGGTIAAEGNPDGVGTCLSFTLPTASGMRPAAVTA